MARADDPTSGRRNGSGAALGCARGSSGRRGRQSSAWHHLRRSTRACARRSIRTWTSPGAGRQLVDKSLVEPGSNIYSESCPKGLIPCRTGLGSNPRDGPGKPDRRPQGRWSRAQRRIDDHEQSRLPVCQSADIWFLRALLCPPHSVATNAPGPTRLCDRVEDWLSPTRAVS